MGGWRPKNTHRPREKVSARVERATVRVGGDPIILDGVERVWRSSGWVGGDPTILVVSRKEKCDLKIEVKRSTDS